MHRLLFIMPRPLAGRWCELCHSDSVQPPHRVQLVSIGEYLGAFFLYPVLRR